MKQTLRLSGKRRTEKTGGKGVRCCIALDYPQDGARISRPHYAFRIGTLGEIENVEISLDNCAWQPCRESAGYWWYEWSGYAEGLHQVVSRARTKDGRVLTSEVRKFQVQ